MIASALVFRRSLCPALVFVLVCGGACVPATLTPGADRPAPPASVDLRRLEWYIAFEDSRRFADPRVDVRGSSRWHRIDVPSNWMKLRDHPGVAWYRLRVVLPPELQGLPAGLFIQNIFNADETYWDGERIGNTGVVDDYNSHGYNVPRAYSIPADHTGAGEHVLAIRVRGHFPDAGGIRDGPIFLSTSEEAARSLVRLEQQNLLFVLIFGLTGVFFVWLHAVAGRPRGAFSFGAANVFAAILELGRAPLTMEFADDFLFARGLVYFGVYGFGAASLSFWSAYFRVATTPIHVIYYGFCILVMAACLLSSDVILWRELQSLWFFISVALSSVVIVFLARHIWFRRRDAFWLAAAFGICLAGAVQQWLVVQDFFDGPRLFPYGFLVMDLIVAVILYRSLYQHFREVRLRVEQLDHIDRQRGRFFENVAISCLPLADRLRRSAEELTHGTADFEAPDRKYAGVEGNAVSLRRALGRMTTVARMHAGDFDEAPGVEPFVLARRSPQLRFHDNREDLRITGSPELLERLVETLADCSRDGSVDLSVQDRAFVFSVRTPDGFFADSNRLIDFTLVREAVRHLGGKEPVLRKGTLTVRLRAVRAA